ncbi:hypothetical protein TELCIR_02136 [Teladorsagia circumcincta]|uniref:Chondroitin proteoglycan 4 domain-containing protein n=1 Tax=Teladorsagia circumcincta TaxID=45464 RepID=A0A2G9UZZ8_TELCI|nr:hypothetical protein TELCIR_02136 [Teladorsagia circumcincta]
MWCAVIFFLQVFLTLGAPDIPPNNKVTPSASLKSTGITPPNLPKLPTLRSLDGTTESTPVPDAMSDLLAAPHPSPLDEKIMDGVQAANPFGFAQSALRVSFFGNFILDLSRSWLTGEELAEEFHLLPDCQRKCTKTLHDSLLGTFKRATYVVKYHKICRSYKEAKSCVDEEKVRCSESSDMFEMLTSGIEYMCVEQGKGMYPLESAYLDLSWVKKRFRIAAFNATIKCIDRNSHAVKARKYRLY